MKTWVPSHSAISWNPPRHPEVRKIINPDPMAWYTEVTCSMGELGSRLDDQSAAAKLSTPPVDSVDIRQAVWHKDERLKGPRGRCPARASLWRGSNPPPHTSGPDFQIWHTYTTYRYLLLPTQGIIAKPLLRKRQKGTKTMSSILDVKLYRSFWVNALEKITILILIHSYHLKPFLRV